MVRRGRPSRRPTAVADTASGGATIAPSVTRSGQRQLGHRLVGDETDCERRRERQSDREQADRADVLAQRDVAALGSRRPQQGRQDDVQDQLGVEHDVVQDRDGAGRQTRDHQRQRRRHVIPSGHRGQQDRHDQNGQQ